MNAKDLFKDSIDKRLQEEHQYPNRNRHDKPKSNKLIITIGVLMGLSMLVRFIMTLVSSL